MFRLGIVGILITAILGYLGHTFIKYWIGKLFHRKPDNVFEIVRLILIPIAAGIGLYVLFQTQQARELAEDRQHNSQAKIETLEERELWRPWAMIIPTGEIATDIYGIKRENGGTRAKRHQEIFIREGSKISFDLNACPMQEYRDKVKSLIITYPYIPYGYVVLSWCLKILNDPSWKAESEKAKEVLEKLIAVKPHVLAIDGYYFMAVRNILEMPIDENKFWDRGEKGEYIPKGMP